MVDKKTKDEIEKRVNKGLWPWYLVSMFIFFIGFIREVLNQIAGGITDFWILVSLIPALIVAIISWIRVRAEVRAIDTSK